MFTYLPIFLKPLQKITVTEGKRYLLQGHEPSPYAKNSQGNGEISLKKINKWFPLLIDLTWYGWLSQEGRGNCIKEHLERRKSEDIKWIYLDHEVAFKIWFDMIQSWTLKLVCTSTRLLFSLIFSEGYRRFLALCLILSVS